eukprot:comp19628_c0_seq1/m.23159 comp19628_c0_seq1/g.23159  ORF comp19628_c0_seq1/g.23159 comp19628_c0_seq1/m.23159 type:complete len:124 (-) comp19628_c0_seq1:485-856(-)
MSSPRKVRFAPEPPKHRSPKFHERNIESDSVKDLLKTRFPRNKRAHMPPGLTASKVAMLCLELEGCNVDQASTDRSDQGSESTDSNPSSPNVQEAKKVVLDDATPTPMVTDTTIAAQPVDMVT